MAPTTDMTEYRAMAENALRASRAAGSRRVVSNRGTEHARAVTGVMISSADRSLSFLCARFSEETFEVEKVREFLERPGAQMHVLLDSAFDPAHPSALSHLTAYMTGDDPRLKVRRIVQTSKVHFGVADERDVRIETDTEARKATVVFGDGRIARETAQRFKALWDAARPVSAQDVPPAR